MEQPSRPLIFALAESPMFARVREPTELAAVPRNVEALSLELAKIGDEDVKVLPVFPRLRVLDLDGTEVTDEALGWVAQQSSLEELWLECTAVTDAGLRHLHCLHRLRFVSLAYTEVTEAGMCALRAAVPAIEISPP
jgi:internalin A